MYLFREDFEIGPIIVYSITIKTLNFSFREDFEIGPFGFAFELFFRLQERFNNPQVESVTYGLKKDNYHDEQGARNPSLFLDLSGSEWTDCSAYLAVLDYQEGVDCNEKANEGNISVGRFSSCDSKEEEEDGEKVRGLVCDLCKMISKEYLKQKKIGFVGTRIRLNYSSEDEVDEEIGGYGQELKDNENEDHESDQYCVCYMYIDYYEGDDQVVEMIDNLCKGLSKKENSQQWQLSESGEDADDDYTECSVLPANHIFRGNLCSFKQQKKIASMLSN